jgi:hypothetical protein
MTHATGHCSEAGIRNNHDYCTLAGSPHRIQSRHKILVELSFMLFSFRHALLCKTRRSLQCSTRSTPQHLFTQASEILHVLVVCTLSHGLVNHVLTASCGLFVDHTYFQLFLICPSIISCFVVVSWSFDRRFLVACWFFLRGQ